MPTEPPLSISSPDEYLFVGGPADGERMTIVEVSTVSWYDGHKDQIYYRREIANGIIFVHESLTFTDALRLLIASYPRPAK